MTAQQTVNRKPDLFYIFYDLVQIMIMVIVLILLAVNFWFIYFSRYSNLARSKIKIS